MQSNCRMNVCLCAKTADWTAQHCDGVDALCEQLEHQMSLKQVFNFWTKITFCRHWQLACLLACNTRDYKLHRKLVKDHVAAGTKPAHDNDGKKSKTNTLLEKHVQKDLRCSLTRRQDSQWRHFSCYKDGLLTDEHHKEGWGCWCCGLTCEPQREPTVPDMLPWQWMKVCERESCLTRLCGQMMSGWS